MHLCKKHIIQPTLLLALAFLPLTLCSPAYAHPHVFVDYRITFIFSPSGLRGVALVLDIRRNVQPVAGG